MKRSHTAPALTGLCPRWIFVTSRIFDCALMVSKFFKSSLGREVQIIPKILIDTLIIGYGKKFHGYVVVRVQLSDGFWGHMKLVVGFL
jgi:hypothetical protein